MDRKIWYTTLLAVVGGALCLVQKSRADDLTCPPICEPGFMIVEEICYKDVVHKCCQPAPLVKKITKPIYDVKCIDYCRKGISFGYEHGCCSACDEAPCGNVHTRKVLLKKFATQECPSCTCEVKNTVERMAYKVYHKVPCPPGGAPIMQAPPMQIPPDAPRQ